MARGLAEYLHDPALAFCPGVFPCLELMAARPELAAELWLSPDGERNAGVEKLVAMAEQRQLPVRRQPGWLQRVARKDNCYAMVVFQRYQDQLLPGRHILLHQPADAGNLGTILRTAAAFSYLDVAIVGQAVDRFSPAAVRASMGGVFRLRTAHYDSFEAYRAENPGQACYPFMLQGSVAPAAAAADAPQQITLAFGNEAQGLPEEAAGWGQPVRIDQSPLVDSLNLAVSAAVGMYAFNQQR